MLPAGLMLDAGRRVISGTPRTAARRATYAWTATDEDGDTATVRFAIVVEPDSMPTFGDTVADQSYRVSTAIVALVLPAASAGDGELQYALTPTLPPGLVLDIATRTVSGTPTAQAGSASTPGRRRTKTATPRP